MTCRSQGTAGFYCHVSLVAGGQHSIDLPDFGDKFAVTIQLDIAYLDGFLAAEGHIVEHQPEREIAVVRNGEKLAARVLLVVAVEMHAAHDGVCTGLDSNH